MILSNAKNTKDDLNIRSIKTLGDTLHDKGFLYAGQFCYLMAQLDFGSYANKNSKLVLITADHSLPFEAFVTSEAIQATEIYEYAQKLSNPDLIIPTLQYYKYLYAIRLVDSGLAADALHYLEEIAAHIAKRPDDVSVDNGIKYDSFVENLIQLAEQLKYLDPSYLMRDGEFGDMPDPEWLTAFRNNEEYYRAIHNNHYVLTANTSVPAYIPDAGADIQTHNYIKTEGYNLNNNFGGYGEVPSPNHGAQESYPDGGENTAQFQQSGYLTNRFEQINQHEQQLPSQNLHYDSYGLTPDSQPNQIPYDPGQVQPSEEGNYESEAKVYAEAPPMFSPLNIGGLHPPPPTPGSSADISNRSPSGSLEPSPQHHAQQHNFKQPTPPLSSQPSFSASEVQTNYFGSENFQSKASVARKV